MSQADVEIRNVRVGGHEPLQAIGISGASLVYVGEPQGASCEIEGHGLIALPGAIDGHTHFRTFGEAYKEDWAHAVRAALSGGVTTILDMGNHPPPHAVTTAEAFAQKVHAVGAQPITYKFWFMATPGGIREFLTVWRNLELKKYLAGIKLCMETTTGGLVVEVPRDQLDWCETAAATDTLIAAHVGVEAMVRQNRARFIQPCLADHCVIRDTQVELEGGRQFLEKLEITGARGEIKHVSTPELVAECCAALERGVNVSLETCPHYWTFTDEQLRQEDGAFFKMNPPLRTVDQVAGILRYLGDATIGTIATDHAPHTKEEKTADGYDLIPSGIPGIQEMLPLAITLVQQGRITLDRLLALTARNPARRYKLPRKGTIAPGFDADLVLVDLNEAATLSDEAVLSKCGWTPYHGVSVFGIPQLVVARGAVVVNRLKPALSLCAA